MTRTTLRRLLPAVLATLLATSSAFAAPAKGPVEEIQAANEKLRTLMAQKADDAAARERISRQITTELRDLLDIGFLTERALADHWGKMTPKQRDEIKTTLQAIVEKNYVSQLRGHLDYRIDYSLDEQKGEDSLVKTVIHARRNNRPSKIKVDYRMRAEGSGWRIYDVVTEGVSILNNYRAQFNRIIAKDGVDGLISRMKTKLEKGGEK